MLHQDFKILPNGAVKGGSFTYTADELTGDISYSGEVSVGLWPFSKTERAAGQYKADPTQLLSVGLQPGKQIAIGPATFVVNSVLAGRAQVTILVSGQPVSGVAIVDVTQKYISIASMVAQVKVPILGTLTIEADPSVGLLGYLLRLIAH